RTFSHWTPHYLSDRLKNILYIRRYPERPWITKTAHDVLASFLRKSDVGLEFGSGRSTIWFAKRVGHLTSVESDPVWHERVTSRLSAQNISNVESLLFPGPEEAGKGNDSAYANVARKFAPHSLDFVLVDGLYRDSCALLSLDAIRPGGLLIIDNVNWFLPTTSRAPASIRTEAELRDDNWKTLYRTLSGWRRIWTTDGVTDTAVFIKPPA
ncbi:MAG: hypothetical protein ABIP90_02835, partial [Vicinamibacterales bacterium]